MLQGRVIIDFLSEEEGDCRYTLKQKGKDELDTENLISLFEHIIRDLMNQDQS